MIPRWFRDPSAPLPKTRWLVVTAAGCALVGFAFIGAFVWLLQAVMGWFFGA